MVSRSSTSSMALPAQTTPDNYRTTPQQYAPTVRTDFKRVLTTGFGGKFLPVAAIPLLREDRLQASTFRFGFQMAETAQMLMNPVRVAVHAWFVPKLAFERYGDRGILNRSYLKQAEKDGEVVPWFQPVDYWQAANTPHPVYRAMGLHAPAGEQVNSDYVEAYNAIWNYVAEQASPSIAKRGATDPSLAPAFWAHSAMRHVKPTFDQALIWGEAPVNITSQQMAVKGLLVETNAGHQTGEQFNPDGTSFTPPQGGWAVSALNSGAATKESGWIAPWVELEENGVTISLANIDLARKTAAFARARQAYQGLGDEQLIDLLMAGVRVPDEGMRHPLLLGRRETIFGMSQRYATDSPNLEKSVTTGQTVLDMTVVVPQQDTSGVVMFVAEILPEQLYERQADRYLLETDQANLPDRLRDELDVEPVEVVLNGHIDTDHSAPTATFGYAPLNHSWQREAPNLGGLYHRPDASAPWDENRNRIWAVETVDPVLGDDFYLSSNIHHQVFQDMDTDPFEIALNGVARIEGLTMFGPALRESYGDYDAIMAHADMSRLDPPDPAAVIE